MHNILSSVFCQTTTAIT